MKSFGLTDKGAVRRENQDSFSIEKCAAGESTVLVLCDGMGGANAGALASRIACREFASFVSDKLSARGRRKPDIPQLLEDACKNANNAVYDYALFDENCEGMGTTLVGGVIKNNGKGYIINVGDSRAYKLSLKNGAVTRITKDHSLVQLLVDSGAITPEQAETHPQKNVITRAVGTAPTVETDIFKVELGANELLLLCSDGLTNTLTEAEILQTAKEKKDTEALCRELMKKALEQGARDNVTVVVVIK